MSDNDHSLRNRLASSFNGPTQYRGAVGGLNLYTAIPDRWCFRCQRERPAVYCSICRSETQLISEIHPDKIHPRSRLGRIVDRFSLWRLNRRR